MSECIKRCDLCGGSCFKEIYQKPDEFYHPDEYFTVVECTGCGLGFVNPRPSISEIGRYYPPEYYKCFDVDKEYHERRYACEADYVDRHGGSSSNRMLLDVGSANGGFPAFIKGRGWRVECVEPFGSREIKGVTVFKVMFPDILVNEPKYDVITMWAVLEHVHHPSLYFKKAAKILRPNGVMICNVTNFESIASRHLYAEDVPRHLYFFTKKTFARYLTQVGMRLEKAYYRKDLYRMLPINVLFYLRSRILGREFLYKDMVRGVAGKTVLEKIMNFMHSPMLTMDGNLARILEQYEMITGRYGYVTYVARKL